MSENRECQHLECRLGRVCPDCGEVPFPVPPGEPTFKVVTDGPGTETPVREERRIGRLNLPGNATRSAALQGFDEDRTVTINGDGLGAGPEVLPGIPLRSAPGFEPGLYIDVIVPLSPDAAAWLRAKAIAAGMSSALLLSKFVEQMAAQPPKRGK